ncbi:HIT domain-containing protein [Acidobacteriota bacterium]
MKRLFTPWRYDYIVSEKDSECIFCKARECDCDDPVLILYRGREVFTIVNRFPYNNGHIMIAPSEHVSALEEISVSALEEMARILKETERILKEAYRPTGFNVGMNLGRTSGAGIPEHLHLHIVPRWEGDSSFMTVFDDTRVIPERIEDTYAKLKPKFDKLVRV